MKKIILIFSIFFFCCGSVLSEGNQYSKALVGNVDRKKILKEFDEYAVKTQRQWNVPGMAVALIIGDEIVYKKSFGVKQVNKRGRVNEKTLFQIASCTKAFTATLFAILVDRGYLRWDDKVKKYIPDFRLDNRKVSDEMTIEDLLSQYSGLPSYSQHLMMLFGYDKNDIIHSMRYIKSTGKFRQTYSYQNNLYLLAGEIVKKATGKSWDDNIKEYIFNPLAMNSSSCDYKSYLRAENRSVGHYYAGGKLTPLSDELTYNSWPYDFASAGGINSNIDDMARWLLFTINGGTSFGYKLISDEHFEKLFVPKILINGGNSKSYYCMGWKRSEYEPEDIIWHSGSTDGEGSYVSFMKDNRIGIAVLMNLPNGRMAEALAKKFYDLYADNPEINWSVVKLAEANKAHKRRSQNVSRLPDVIIPPMDLKRYTGIYNNILYGDVEIKLEEGVLKFSAGQKRVWITLKHRNGNSFDAVGVPGWRFKSPMFVFRVYENTNVRGLIVEDMTDGTDSLFRKVG